jgi:hypothetical protein
VFSFSPSSGVNAVEETSPIALALRMQIVTKVCISGMLIFKRSYEYYNMPFICAYFHFSKV